MPPKEGDLIEVMDPKKKKWVDAIVTIVVKKKVTADFKNIPGM